MESVRIVSIASWSSRSVAIVIALSRSFPVGSLAGGHCSPVGYPRPVPSFSRITSRPASTGHRSARAAGRARRRRPKVVVARRPRPRRRRSPRAGRSRPGPTSRAASSLHQGGSAANTARWLARLDVPTQLVGSVGRDAAGRALVEALRADRRHDPRPPGRRRPDRPDRRPRRSGRRALVRGRPRCGRRARAGATCGAPGSRAPSCSTCRPTRCSASRSGRPVAPRFDWRGPPGRESASTWRRSGRCSRTVAARPRRSSASVAPDLLFATAAELHGLLGAGGRTDARAVGLAPIVVIKRGAAGVTVLVRDDPGPAERGAPRRRVARPGPRV